MAPHMGVLCVCVLCVCVCVLVCVLVVCVLVCVLVCVYVVQVWTVGTWELEHCADGQLEHSVGIVCIICKLPNLLKKHEKLAIGVILWLQRPVTSLNTHT